jgi:ring-1,2-phenylacetyl-CoA epoxidase subunit PaaE
MDSSIKKIRIKSIRQETPEAKTFFLEYPDRSPIPYQAGQFLTLIFPKAHGAEARRSYSFCTSPGVDPTPAITVKRITNGEFSRPLIDHALPGDEFLTIGASGYFNLPEDLTPFQQIIFLAAGSGITPIFSLIKKLLLQPEKHSPIPQSPNPSIPQSPNPSIPQSLTSIPPRITLIYSNRAEADTIYYQALGDLQTAHADRFTIEFLFSTSTDISKGRLSKGLLEKLLTKHVHGPIHKVLFYLCGPFDYMRMATIVLKTEGVLPAHIRKENFSSVKPRIILQPPDQDAHTLSLTLHGRHYSFVTQHPESILQSAKRLGIGIPFSCESGQCGTCAATCKTGSVWMSNNEVLTDNELAKGRVLTCTGYAVGGDVVLEI